MKVFFSVFLILYFCSITHASVEKLDEELNEFKTAIRQKDNTNIEEEFGDILFTIVNIGRHMKIDSESVLQNTNKKFLERFNEMEKIVKNKGFKLEDLPISELNRYWEKVKKLKDK